MLLFAGTAIHRMCTLGMQAEETDMTITAENMGGNGHDQAARAEEARRRSSSQLNSFFDDVEELLERVAGVKEPDISKLRDKVETSIQTARASARSTAHMAVENTRKAAVATDQYVHRNPWIAIGATATIGLMLGALLRGSRK
jgi:ElaB/YqjD/DUF883 family membrane-anchored ribosome-binding protein